MSFWNTKAALTEAESTILDDISALFDSYRSQSQKKEDKVSVSTEPVNI